MKTTNSYPFYKSLRFRFGLFFGFLFFVVLMAFVFVLYKKIQHELGQGFDNRLKAGAELVLQKTSVNPIVIPLPQNNERFTLVYNNGNSIDTLYSNIAKELSTRNVQLSKTLETRGKLQILYSLPDDDLVQSLASWQRLLFIYLPLTFLSSLLLGYTLSGVLLKPINQIISKAAATDLQTDIQLLPEPQTTDELHQLTEALNRMLERIKHQVAEQNAFFASASHELRTPLSTMLTELQVLEASAFSQQMQAVIESQKAEVQRLIKLVNDFLMMSQLKADALTPKRELIDLLDVCVNSVERLKSRAQAQNQKFRLSALPEEAEFTCYADKQHIEIIIGNLFTNAVKYGCSNSLIEIQLAKSRDSIQLSISNETESTIENPSQLGEQFYRESFYNEGFGLGLWIVRRLLKMNGGHLDIVSKNKQFVAVVSFKL